MHTQTHTHTHFNFPQQSFEMETIFIMQTRELRQSGFRSHSLCVVEWKCESVNTALNKI